MPDDRVEFHDQETSSPGFMVVHRHSDAVTIGFGVDRNGDLDLTISRGRPAAGTCAPSSGRALIAQGEPIADLVAKVDFTK